MLLAALTGCHGQGSGGTPQGEPRSESGTSPSADAGGARAALKAAVEPLLDQSVVDFDAALYSGSALAVETTGRAYQHRGYEATTTSPKELGSAQAPQGDDVKGRMDVRAVADDVYLRLASWKPPLAGCWLRTSGDQVPGGLLALTPGVPGYLTILGAVQAQQVVSGGQGAATLIGGEVSLRIGLQMFTTGVLGLLQLDASRLDGASVPVILQVQNGVVSELDLSGTDLVSAVRAAGGSVAAAAEATVSQLRIAVAYRGGAQDMPPVQPPPADQLMTNADVNAHRGCAADH